MTERIVCPRCSRASYTTAPEVFGPCPYCGFVFNWRSPERRVFERSPSTFKLTVEIDGKKQDAKMVDLSKRGMGVILTNPPFVQVGDQIKCILRRSKEELRETRVVWSKKGDDSQRIGLLYLN
jgi:ribosomal protein L37E